MAEAARLESEQRAAIARSERNRQLQEQMRRDSDRQMQSRQLADLHAHAIEQRVFRHNALRSQAHANARQRLSAALDNTLALKYPPPPPEPTVVVVESDDGSADLGNPNFDVAKWAKKPRSWW